MNAAASVNASHRSPLPPSLHGLRPLLGQVVLRDRLQRTYELAVHDSGEEGIELAGDRDDGRFIEQLEALLDVAIQDEAARLRDSADRGRGGIVLRAQLDRASGPLASCGEVTREQPFIVAGDRHPRVHRRLVVTLEETLRAFDPTADGCHERRVEQQVHGDARRRTRGR